MAGQEIDFLLDDNQAPVGEEPSDATQPFGAPKESDTQAYDAEPSGEATQAYEARRESLASQATQSYMADEPRQDNKNTDDAGYDQGEDDIPPVPAPTSSTEEDTETASSKKRKRIAEEPDTLESETGDVQTRLRHHVQRIVTTSDLSTLSVKMAMKALGATFADDVLQQNKKYIKDFLKEEVLKRQEREDGETPAQPEEQQGSKQEAEKAETDGKPEETTATPAEEKESTALAPVGEREEYEPAEQEPAAEASDDEPEEAASGDEAGGKRKKKRKTKKKYVDSGDEQEEAEPTIGRRKKKRDKPEKSSGSSSSRKGKAEPANKRKRRVGPAKGQTALQIYKKENRDAMREKTGERDQAALSKLLSQQFKELSSKERRFWESKAMTDQDRYMNELEKFRETNPEEAAELEDKKRRPIKPKKDAPAVGSGADGMDDSSEAKPSDGASYVDQILEEIKRRRPKKTSDLSADDIKEMCRLFIDRMNLHYDKDVQELKNNRPAVHRMRFLDEVVLTAAKKHLQDDLINAGLLKSISLWLSELNIDDDEEKDKDPKQDEEKSEDAKPRKSKAKVLPNFTLRTSLYKVLNSLPIDETHLAASNELGRKIMEFWNSPEETPDNKRFLHNLIQKWLRPIYGQKINHKEVAEFEQEVRAKDVLRRHKALSAHDPTKHIKGKSRIPQPAYFDFAYRPQPAGENDTVIKKKKKAEGAKQNLQRKIVSGRLKSESGHAAMPDVTGGGLT